MEWGRHGGDVANVRNRAILDGRRRRRPRQIRAVTGPGPIVCRVRPPCTPEPKRMPRGRGDNSVGPKGQVLAWFLEAVLILHVLAPFSRTNRPRARTWSPPPPPPPTPTYSSSLTPRQLFLSRHAPAAPAENPFAGHGVFFNFLRQKNPRQPEIVVETSRR